MVDTLKSSKTSRLFSGSGGDGQLFETDNVAVMEKGSVPAGYSVTAGMTFGRAELF